MITLNVADKDITGGSIPITWCLDHESIDELMKVDNKNPPVLIITRPVDNYHIKKEQRQIVNLNDLMTYVSFKSPGKNRICLIILDKFNFKTAKEIYLSKWNHVYGTDLFDYDGNVSTFIKLEVNGSSIDVDVPQENFAKDPAAWEKKWVLWLFRDKGIDQCDFRRKRLFAYTIQPFLFLVKILTILLVTLTSGLLIYDSFSLKYLFSPLMYDIEESIYGVVKGRMLLFPTMEIKFKLQNNMLFLLYMKEMFIFISQLLIFCITPVFSIPITLLLITHPVVLIISLTLLSSIVICVICLIAIFCIFDKFFLKEKPDLTNEELLQLICDPDKLGKAPKLSDLPRNKRSIKLHFQNVKSKVCRPFAG